MGKWRKSGPSVDSKCLEIVLNSGFASTRSNSLSTKGCGESRQTCSIFFLADFFTDFEIIGTANEEQGSVNGELRRRTTVTEWRLDGVNATAVTWLVAGFLLGQFASWNLAPRLTDRLICRKALTHALQQKSPEICARPFAERRAGGLGTLGQT